MKIQRKGENAYFNQKFIKSRIIIMKKTYYIIFLFFISCGHFADRKPAQDSSNNFPAIEEKLRLEISNFQELVEESLVWRAKAIEYAEHNKDKFKNENLSHEDMLTLYESMKNYLALREKISELAHRYEKVADVGIEIQYRPDEGTSTELLTEEDKTIIKIDPNDSKGRDFLIKMKISLSAALVLYDNYMIGIYPYYQNKKTRKMINQDIPDFEFKFDKITDNFFDLINRNKIIRAIGLFKKDLSFKNTGKVETSPSESYLEMLSLQSPFYAYISEKKISIESPGMFRAYFDRFFDRVRFMNDTFLFIASKMFGNSVGLVAFREGLLKNISSTEKDDITSNLKPLDLMLEKTPFRLTDQFIPGYYGHVAIWVGDEKDLRELDLWDHPAIKKYQKEIQNGKRIIEALRPGVQINTFDHFLNIDDLLILRDFNLTLQQKKEFLVRAFEQIGKDYDFNFDVETDSKIVCSEIVYVVFHDITWPTKKALGRYTISPDNVAIKTLDQNGPKALEPVLMYRSGEKVKGALLPEIMDVFEVESATPN